MAGMAGSGPPVASPSLRSCFDVGTARGATDAVVATGAKGAADAANAKGPTGAAGAARCHDNVVCTRGLRCWAGGAVPVARAPWWTMLVGGGGWEAAAAGAGPAPCFGRCGARLGGCTASSTVDAGSTARGCTGPGAGTAETADAFSGAGAGAGAGASTDATRASPPSLGAGPLVSPRFFADVPAATSPGLPSGSLPSTKSPPSERRWIALRLIIDRRSGIDAPFVS